MGFWVQRVEEFKNVKTQKGDDFDRLPQRKHSRADEVGDHKSTNFYLT